MIRGTTPTFKLLINDQSVDLTSASYVYATFKQLGGETITKTGADLTVTAQEVDVYLDQAETLKFAKGVIDVQLNWVYSNDARACTSIVRIGVGENLLPRVLPPQGA